VKRGQVLVAAIAIGVVWEGLALIVRRPILPLPTLVIQSFITELPRDLGEHFLASLWRVIASTGAHDSPQSSLRNSAAG